ncbi:hypothetical protein AB5V95_00660 [Metamycoplasma spumans]|uniref:hypothetical protein n=1 Tax=Metamycoplasma spumans TaxID=92406 RepID=UPI0034DD8EE4
MTPSISLLPMIVLSTNLNTNNENINIDKEDLYKKIGACNFTKLTVRLDENISIVSKNYEDANNDII